jgi:hypothetical protein
VKVLALTGTSAASSAAGSNHGFRRCRAMPPFGANVSCRRP